LSFSFLLFQCSSSAPLRLRPSITAAFRSFRLQAAGSQTRKKAEFSIICLGSAFFFRLMRVHTRPHFLFPTSWSGGVPSLSRILPYPETILAASLLSGSLFVHPTSVFLSATLQKLPSCIVPDLRYRSRLALSSYVL